MELELGLKVTRTRDDVSSSVDFRFSKDPFGPLVLSQETDSRFIIIIHLKGFKKEGIEIDINKEGDKITIRGRKPVEEMVMIRWMAWRKEVEMRAFKKVFFIPDVVDLDKIKARFDDDDATLTITMPKRVKGISGFNLEQEEEEEDVDFGDVSEVENREECDEQSETLREEDFGEMMEDKERESQVSEGEEEGFCGGVDEEEAQVEDDDLEKIQQIDEQDKVLEFAEEETVGQQELADSDIESEDSGLEKLLDIKEEEVMEHKVSEEIKSEDTGSGAVEETEEQESDEDSGLKKLLDIIEQEDKQEVMEEKVSEEAKSDDLKSEATEEIEEQASDEDSGLKNLPDIIEDSQEVIEQKVSEDTRSDDTGPRTVQEIEKQESDDESGLKNLQDIIEQEDNQKVMEHKVPEEIKSFDTGPGAVEEQESDEESGLEKPPYIIEQEENKEVVEQKVSEENISEDIGSGAVEETEKQETDEVVGTSKSREMKNKKTDGGDDDDGLRKAQGTEEPERYNQESKIQEMFEEKQCGQEKINNKDAKGESDVKETQTEDGDNLEKSQHEIADSVTESEDRSSLRKPTDVLEQDVKKQKDSQEETRSDGIGSGAFDEIQKQEPHEHDDGLRKAQGIREPERRNEVRKNQEMVEGETNDNVKMETKSKDPKEDVDAEIGEGSTPNTERSQVVAEDDAETNSEELESRKSDKKHELVEKKEEAEEDTKVRRQSEDSRSLVKLQENEEQHSKGRENIKELMEEKTPEAETNIANDVPKPEVGSVVKTDDSVTDSRSLRKPADILEQENNEEVMEQKDSQEETRSDGFGCRESEEIEKQEPCAQLDGASKSREKADDDGLSKVQGTEEPERRKEVSKNHEMVEGDLIEDVDAEMGEGFTPNNERRPVAAETETKPEELESEKTKADKVDKKNELVENKEEEEDNTKLRRKSEEQRSLTKFQENEEQRSKRPEHQDKHENIKELVKEKAPEAEKNIENDVAKPVHETEASEVDTVVKTDDEGKEKKKSVKMETAPNIAETETKPEDIESEKQGAAEVDKMHKLVEKKEQEVDKVKEKGEDRSLIKVQENEEQHSKEKQQDIQENIKELTEENDVPRPVQETGLEVGTLGETSDEVKEKKSVANIVETETKPEDFESDEVEGDEVEKIHKLVEKKEEEDENNSEVGKQSEDISSIKPQEVGEQQSQGKKPHEKIKELVEDKTAEAETNIENDTPKPVQEETKDAESRKPQETIKQKELDECERSKQESKTQELVKSKTNDIEKEEKEIEETVTKEQESCRPKVLGEEEEEKFKELDEEKPHFAKNRKFKDEEDILEKKTELGDDDDISRKAGDSDPKEKVDAEMGKGFAPSIAETETKPEDFESEKPVEKKEEEDAIVRRKNEDRSLIKLHENEEQHSEGRKRQDKQESIKDLVEEKSPEEETNVMNDVQTPVHQETEASDVDTVVKTDDEGKEKKKNVKMETTLNIAETETKPEDIESEKQGADEVDKMHKLVEKKEEEDANARSKSEDSILTKLQEDEELNSKGRKGQEKQENIKELVEEKTPEAERSMGNDVLKPVQEIEVPNIAVAETKPQEFGYDKVEPDEVEKIHKLVEKKEDEDEKNGKAGTQSEDISSIKPQGVGEQLSQRQKPHDKHEKIRELVEDKTPEVEKTIEKDTPKPVQEETKDVESRKPQETIRQTNDEEKEEKDTEEIVTKEQDSCRPKALGGEEEEEKVQELDEEKPHFSKNRNPKREEKVPEKKIELGDDDCSRKAGDSGARELDAEMGKGFATSIAETETKHEVSESEKLGAVELEKIQKPVEKKDEKAASVRRKSEDRSLIKLQENEEPHSKRRKRQEKQENFKELVKEKAPEEETNVMNDVQTPVHQELEPELGTLEKTSGKEKKKSESLDAKEELDVKLGVPNTGETETKPDEFVSDQLESGKVEEIHELVEKKKEVEDEKNAEVGTESEEGIISLLKPQEIGEQQQSQQHYNQGKIEAETNRETDNLKPVQERGEGKQKIPKLSQEERKEHKEKMVETGNKIDDAGSRKVQEIIRQHDQGVAPNIAETETKPEELDKLESEEVEELVEKKEEEEDNAKKRGQSEDSIRQQELDECERCEKESKNQELVKGKTNDEEKEEENFSKNRKLKEEEKNPEKKTELGDDDDISRKDGDSDAKEEVDAEMGRGFAQSIAETETKHEDFEAEKVGADEVEKKEEEDANVRRKNEERGSLIKLQEDAEKEAKEKKNSVSLEVRNRDAKEEIDVKMSLPNISVAETRPKEFESDQLKADKVDKIHELVEKKEEEDDKNAKVGTQSEDISLIKPQEVREKEKVDDAGSRKDQEIIRCKESKTKESVKSKTKDEEKGIEQTETKEQVSYKPKLLWDEETAEKKIGFDEVLRRVGDTEERDSDSKEEVDVEMGKGFKLNIAETETKGEEFDLIKLKEDEEPHSKGRKQQEKQETIKELVEEKAPEAETYVVNEVPKQVQDNEPEVGTLGETCDEGNEVQGKKKSVSLEVKSSDAKEEVDAKLSIPNIAETDTRPKEFESEEVEADEVDQIHELVEKKEEDEETNTKVGTQCEDISLLKPQEVREQQSQGRKGNVEQEKIEELVEEKTPEAETNRASDTPKPVQKRCEGKQKIQKNFQEETKKQPEEHKEKMVETGEKIHDAGPRKVQEIIRQQDLDEAEKIQEQAEEKTDCLKNDDDQISRKNGDTEQRDSDSKEEFDAETGEGFTPKTAEAEKKTDEVDKIHELVEKNKEYNATVRRKSEDSSLDRLQEQNIEGPNRRKKQEDIKEFLEEKPVQETERSETCKDKVFAETETKDQESYRPKILEGEDKTQELAEEKMNFSRKVDEEEETAENNKELSDDDMSRKSRDMDAVKGKEENEEFQELAQEEQISDGRKKIVGEAISENGRQRKVQEIDEHQPKEEDKHGNQFQKLIGETSGQGENEDAESEKKATEADKRFRVSQEIERTDSDVSGKYGKGEIFQELQKEEKEDEADIPERGTGTIQQELVNLNSQMEQETGEETQEVLDERINHCKEEEESETKTDDVIRMLEDIKEQELLEPTRNHVSKIEEVIEEKIAEPEIEDEYGGLRKVHGSEEQESYERFKTNIIGTEEPSGQEKEVKEKVIEFRTVTEKEKSPNAQEIKDQRPDKESHEKPYKIQELVGAGHNDHHDGFKRPVVQDKKQETEEKEMNMEVEEKEIVERRTKPEDVSFRKGQDDEDPEMSKPYMPQEKDKIQEPVEMGTSDYKETDKKPDGNDTLRRQEPGKPNLDELESHSEQKKIHQGEDKIQEPVEMRTHDYSEKAKKQDEDVKEEGKVEDGSSDQFQEIEERKSHEDWSDEMQEKRKDFGKEEKTFPKESEEKNKTRAVEEEKEIVERKTKTRDGSLRNVQDNTDPDLSKPYKSQGEDKNHEPVETGTSEYREEVKKQDEDESFKDKHTAEADHYDHKEEQEEEKVIAKTELKAEEDTTGKIQETEKQKPDELQRYLVQDKLQETEEKDKTRAMEEKEILERRTKNEDGSLREVGDGKEPESSKPYKRRDEDKIQEMETSDYSEKDKAQDGDDVLRSQETGKMDLLEEEAIGPKYKHTGGKGELEKRYEKVEQTETKVEDEINTEVEEIQKEEEDSLDDPVTKTQESEKEESHEPEFQEKLDIVQDFVEDETSDQEDDVAKESAAVEANYDEDSSRLLQSIKEHEEHKEQRNDHGVEGEDEERIDEKETKEKDAHVQELEGKTENFKDYNDERRGQETKQGKTVQPRNDYGNVRKVGETKVQESDERKDQEPDVKTEELERKETSSHEVKLVTEEDSLIKGQEILEKESSKRRPVGQENIQQHKNVEKQEDEKKSGTGVEMQANIKEEKGIEASEKVSEVEMQAKTGIRMKEQDTKRQDPYELLENEEHDKIPQLTVEETKHEREEDREVEEMNRKSEDVSSREVQKIKAEDTYGLEKELNEAGGSTAVLETKYVEDSSQKHDVEEKGSDQTEQEKIRELLAKEEQNEKAKRMPQVAAKANDDISEKNETERLREQKKHKDSQPVAKTETSDKRKEEKEEKIVGKAVTRDEYDSSRKNQEHEEEQSDKLERHGEEEEMSGSLAKEGTSKDKEENRGSRAGAETTIKDDKNQLLAEKDTSGKAKESRDGSSRKTQEKEKQESHQQKRNYEEQDKKKLRPNYYTRDEDGKEDKETAEAEVTRKSKGIEQGEATKMEERHDYKDNITDLVEDKMNNQEGDDKSEETRQDKSKELVQQRSTDNLKDEETANTETKVKDKESTKTHQQLMREIQEIDKEESDEPRKDVERDKNQPVDSETSEEDSEELEVEVEDSEEDWEAEVIQEMDSDDDSDKLRKIRRIKLGFRLVGGSTLFMSLIVIVFRLIHSKRKLKCYKF